MLGLTPLGIVHTAIGLIAVVTAIVAFVRFKEIAPDTLTGRLYIWTTIGTCVTAMGIFQHGGFGKPHVLALLTLATLAAAWVIARWQFLGASSPYVAMVAYSLTFLFHMIPSVTETFTRIPVGAPLFTGPDDPTLQSVFAIFFMLFVVGATLQLVRLRGRRRILAA